MSYAQTQTKKPRSSLSRSFSKRRKDPDNASVPTSEQWKSWKRMQFCTGKSTTPVYLALIQLIVPRLNKWRIPETRSLRGSYFVWETSALVLPFMPLRVLTTDSSYSILVLNHDWQPDRRYDLWDSWVGKIIDIRGNSPRNVRSSSLSGYSCSPASPKDLGNYTMVLLRG